jgi:SNF2 family DNA or RNA helicase
MNATDPISVDYSFTTEMSEEEKAQYWQTQQSLSTVSALTKSYRESCELLGYDPVTPTPFPEDLEKKKAYDQLAQRVGAERQAAIDAGEEPERRILGPPPKVLVLNGWQVMGAQWSIEQERGPIGGSIVCDDCGTGKTIQMLVVIHEHLQRMKAEHVVGNPDNPRYRPTIVLAPAPVVDVWFEEINKWFPQLQAWRYFEHVNKVNNAFMKGRTLPTKGDELVQWLKRHCPPDDPNSCSYVVISAYETFMLRTLKVAKKEKDSRPLAGTSTDCSLPPCPLTPAPPHRASAS